MHDPYALKIYIDGSAYRNPGHEGGLAGIAEFPDGLNRDPEIIFEESYDRTTNNRMELRACIRAFKYIRENAKPLNISRAIILTDSQYVIENHKYAPFWRKNGWRNRHNRPVENKELCREVLSLRSKAPVRVARSNGFESVQEFCETIATFLGEDIRLVDSVLWRFATMHDDYALKFSRLMVV
jgi:ribonuclease HI